MKTDVDRLILVSITETKFSIYFTKIELFFIFETKSSLSTSFFILFTISRIFKSKCNVFWTQTCRNLKSIKFADFLSFTCP